MSIGSYYIYIGDIKKMTKYEELINLHDDAVRVAQSRIEENYFDIVTSNTLDFIYDVKDEVLNLTLKEACKEI